MIKTISQIVSGIIFILLGIYMTVVYLQEQQNGASIFLLLIAAFLVGLGIFFLVNLFLSLAKAKTAAKLQAEAITNTSKTLDKNNSLLSEWNKTNKTRDKLKMLQISTQAENQQ